MNRPMALLHLRHVRKHAQAAEDAVASSNEQEAQKQIHELLIDLAWVNTYVNGD
jgi:hypothetical protein